MKHVVMIALTLSLTPFAAQAEEERGLSLMERGAQLFMEGLGKEMEPAFEGLEGLADQMGPALKNFATEMGPKLTELLEQVDDWSAYTAPEMLPNGDIIIRRKPDHPMVPPEVPTEPEPQIDL